MAKNSALAVQDLDYPDEMVTLLHALTALRQGQYGVRLPSEWTGIAGKVADAFNDVVSVNEKMTSELNRLSRAVGKEGKLGQRLAISDVDGFWRDSVESVNELINDLVHPTSETARVIGAVAEGDLSQTMALNIDDRPLRGEFLRTARTINTMVDQLGSFAAEVTRVAREVGTEGKLGGQAQVEGVAGTWKDLTDSVNFMAANLTTQVRGIAKVVTSVANGELKRKLTVEAKGEIAELADTINNMTDTLATFADQVTTVAREVGVEGQLGGQAKVPGASGTWKGLTENVNQLAANLTTQVRAIAEVAIAVTKGDLTRAITVGAQGEVAVLKDTINEMIRNLRDTTQKNTEQDWLKTNLAKFSRMLQGQRDLKNVGRMVLSELCPVVTAQQAEFYVLDSDEENPNLTLLASFASEGKEELGKKIGLGKGVVGQCAIEKKKIVLDDLPDNYVRISSGLGEASPRSVLVLPLIFEGQVKGVLELASFGGFNPLHQALLDQLTESIGIVLNTIEANMRTEDLLTQSQSLAQQLQTRQEELQLTNAELEEKAHLLAQQNQEVERKNSEVEQARQELEDKAKQLALTSKYKSEFLANMSHELRTPLNSLLILSDQLNKNPEGNLTSRQTEHAKTIHSSGKDLLMLINDILDLSKIESGTVMVEGSELRLEDLHAYVSRTFKHVAESKNVDFAIGFDSRLPDTMFTDAKRLQQIIKNLLSNAFKFTHHGQVTLTVSPATEGWSYDNDELNRASEVLSFSVSDTGIGIVADKQMIIFEAFQQADGSTSRKYGGTGLGLAISRELSRLLGGEIRLSSVPGKGSIFTLYLPTIYSAPRIRKVSGSQEVINASGNVLKFKSPEPNKELIPVEQEVGLLINELGDDRDFIQSSDVVTLIVENDLGFAKFILDSARSKGHKVLATSLGAVALALTQDYQPDAIMLDINLLDMQGWRILERLKNDINTRHIPVCVISTDESREKALSSGAFAFVAKPIDSGDVIDTLLAMLKSFTESQKRKIIAIEPDKQQRESIEKILADDKFELNFVSDIKAAKKLLKKGMVDCLIINPSMAGSVAELLKIVPSEPIALTLPVVVYGKGATDKEASNKLQHIHLAGIAHSEDRLLDLVTFYTHLNILRLSEKQRSTLSALHQSDKQLSGRKVLIVDDDMRNIFALSSVLEEHNMEILSADNGHDAVNILKEGSDVEIVLMDIMMPEMDGMETMREIRKIQQLKNLPIVAVTAKAMKGDREKCIEAGAWDYLSKPVDTEQLISTLKAWLNDKSHVQ